MIYKDFLCYLTFTFVVSSLRGGLHGFYGTWLCCNSLEWNGAPKRRTRGPAKRGSGSVGDAAIAFHVHGAPASRFGVAPSCGRHCSALRGRIPRYCALPCTEKTTHSTPPNCRI